MRRYLNFFIALIAIQGDLYAAEAGMPQLDPKYWASQAFWLILVFTVLYFSISKFYLPKIKNNLDDRENKIKNNQRGNIEVLYKDEDDWTEIDQN